MHGNCEIYGLTEEGDRDSGRIAIQKQCKYGDQIMAVLFRECRRVLLLYWAEYLTLKCDPARGSGDGHTSQEWQVGQVVDVTLGGGGIIGVMQLDFRASLHFHLGPAGEY